MSLISQFHRQIRTYIYNPVYKGPFEYKNKDAMMSRFPSFGINRTALEKELDEIKDIRNIQINDKDIPPFHLVWRYKPFSGNSWSTKLVLRRLGMHHKERNIPVIIPNSPHYNSLLWEVKHLIQLKPLKFPNGLPTIDDIGSVKMNLNTGEMMINSAYKIPDERLEKADTPPIFTGKYLREYLKWASGLFGKSLPSIEVKRINGTHIKDLDKEMKDYYKHQNKFYLK